MIIAAFVYGLGIGFCLGWAYKTVAMWAAEHDLEQKNKEKQ